MNANRFVIQKASKLPAHTGAVRWRSDSTLILLPCLQQTAHSARITFATPSYDYRPADFETQSSIHSPYNQIIHTLSLQPNHPYTLLTTKSSIQSPYNPIIHTLSLQPNHPYTLLTTKSSIHSPYNPIIHTLSLQPNHPYTLLTTLFSALFISRNSDMTDPTTAIVMTAHQQTSSPDAIQSSHSWGKRKKGRGEGGLIDAVTNAWRNSPEITTQGVSDFCSRTVHC